VLLTWVGTRTPQVEFQKAVELDATYADAYHNPRLGDAEQGKWEEAITAYKKALAQTIYTTPETTYNNLGYAYWALDRRREAEEAFRAALPARSRSSCPPTSGSGSCSSVRGRKTKPRSTSKPRETWSLVPCSESGQPRC